MTTTPTTATTATTKQYYSSISATSITSTTAKINQSVSIKQKLKNILTEYELLVRTLFQSMSAMSTLTSQSPQVATPAQREILDPPSVIIKKIIDKDAELKRALKELEEHQQFQTKLLSLQQTINEKDAAIIEFAAQLHKAQHILQTVVDGAKEKLAAIARAKKGAIEVDDLVAYSHRISASTSAPPSWSTVPANERKLGLFIPPNPQDAEMKKSHLMAQVQLMPDFKTFETLPPIPVVQQLHAQSSVSVQVQPFETQIISIQPKAEQVVKESNATFDDFDLNPNLTEEGI